ncbi:MAG TPA: response regulator, partial [Rhizomicrobium sp.]|nr:response regulator [Rhizomicrobium sp.]
YLVKPVRQSSLVRQLTMCRNGHVPALSEEILSPQSAPQDAAPIAEAPDHGVARIPDSPDARSGLHILLAEDNPINMLLIRELLRRRGHKVTEVTNGNAAVQAMMESRFDLLLTDIHMPGMDGIEAARAIRAAEARGGLLRTPIVALTADVLESGKHACLEAGMDGFLTKPVDPAELEEMFRTLFPGTEASHIVAA